MEKPMDQLVFSCQYISERLGKRRSTIAHRLDWVIPIPERQLKHNAAHFLIIGEDQMGITLGVTHSQHPANTVDLMPRVWPMGSCRASSS